MSEEKRSDPLDDYAFEQCALISASAGTGKTYTITRLVVKLLLGSQGREPLPLENILVVTFTNAATSDLIFRIRQRIRSARLGFLHLKQLAQEGASLRELQESLAELKADDDLKKIFSDKLTEGQGNLRHLSLCYRVLLHAERSIDGAPICTIHSFCNRALNQIYAFEAGQAFDLELSEDLTDLSREALHSLYRELFYHRGKPLRKLLHLLIEQKLFDAELQEGGQSKAAGFKRASDTLQKLALDLLEVRAGRSRETYFGYHIAGFKQVKPSERQYAALKKEILASFARFEQRHQNLLPEWQQSWQLWFETQERTCADFFGEDYLSGPVFGSKKVRFYKELEPLLQSISAVLAGEWPDLQRLSRQAAGLKNVFANKSLLIKNAKPVQPDTDRASAFTQQVLAYAQALQSYQQELTELVSTLRPKLAILYLHELDRLCLSHGVMSNSDLLYKLNAVLQRQVDAGDQTLCSLLRQRYPVAMIDEFQDTDPLQLAIFEKIYLCQEARRDHAVCCFIGDPKQSIYGFRGADIHSYLHAQELIQSPALEGKIFNLPYNHRSAARLVQAINYVFNRELNPENQAPFGQGIAFSDVEAVDRQKLSFHFADREPGGVSKPLFYVNELQAEEFKNKAELTQRQAERCAQTVLHALSCGRLSEQGEERAVRPSDLCVLVRTKDEAHQMQKVLSDHKVRSVFFSATDSVLKSASAGELVFLLSAMCYPSDPKRVVRLLSSPLSGLTPEEFVGQLDDEQIAREMDLLQECHNRWQQTGFLSAFEYWFTKAAQHRLSHLLAFADGERHLTDLYQLSEIVQTQHLKQRSLPSQLKWFMDYCREADKEHLLRLESEVSQVKIYTEHSSKGLEFPLVLLPFICTVKKQSRPERLVLYQELGEGQGGERVLLLNPTAEEISAYHKEQSLEDMRLLYVALTRAKTALFIYPGKVKASGDMHGSPMAKLWTDLAPCLGTSGSAYFGSELLPPLEQLQLKNQESDVPDCAVAEFKRGTVSHQGRTTSYTALTSGLHDLQLPRYEGDAQEETAQSMDSAESQLDNLAGLSLSAFTFPRGTRAGTFLHLLLEKLRFELVNTEELSALAQSLQICDYAAYHQLCSRWCDDDTLALEGLKCWLLQICRTPLYTVAGRSVSLSSLQAGDYLQELDFTFPSLGMKTAWFNEHICIPLAREAVGEQAELLQLQPQEVDGYLKGQIDLFCALPGAQGKQYYVIDYKSTHLGNRYEDYRAELLRSSVFSPQNRYDVQFLIYTLAAHRYLKERLPAYDYARDFGGVMYLYVRGLSETAGQHCGVFAIKPGYEYIQLMDRLFSGKEV